MNKNTIALMSALAYLDQRDNLPITGINLNGEHGDFDVRRQATAEEIKRGFESPDGDIWVTEKLGDLRLPEQTITADNITDNNSVVQVLEQLVTACHYKDLEGAVIAINDAITALKEAKGVLDINEDDTGF